MKYPYLFPIVLLVLAVVVISLRYQIASHLPQALKPASVVKDPETGMCFEVRGAQDILTHALILKHVQCQRGN